MAEATASFPGGNISYTVVGEPNGSTTINVSTAFGDIVRTNTISSALATLNANITRSQKGIASINAEIAAYNVELSKPDLSPFFRDDYTKRIRTLEKDLASTKQYILVNEGAIASINATGQSNIDKATADDNANRARLGLPVSTTPVAPTTANPAAVGNTKPGLAGAASDDSGAGQPNPAGTTGTPPSVSAPIPGTGGTTTSPGQQPAAGSTTPPGNNTASTPTNASNSPNQWQSSYVSSQTAAGTTRPGKRLQNPLGDFSSYTYQLTMYMITPDAYEAFVATGRTKINVLSEAGATGGSGAYVVAQSGGVNKSSSNRAPGFDFDYGIDDLQMKSIINGKQSGNASFITELSFKITEPYGFSFLTNLRKAGDVLFGSTAKPNTDNTLRQMFILGVRFLGYDASGRVMTPNVKMSDGSGIIDPTSQSGELFEYFIDIKVTSMKFKIDGRAVTYSIKAVQQNTGNGFSVSRGFTKSNITTTKGTVGDAVDEFITQMNKTQSDLAKGNKPSLEYPTKYEIIWMPGTEAIYNSSIVSDADTDKTKWPGSGAKTSAESNAAKETNSQTANPSATQIPLANDQPVISCISQVIMRSSFLSDQLSAIYTTQIQADPKTKSQDKIKTAYQSKSLSWFNLTPQISDIKWDSLTNDWAYTIKYLITKYDTPIMDSPMATGNNIYPGPHKRYEYWYTGENREVLQYEQTLDNTYMQVVVGVGDTAIGNAAPAGSTTSTTSSSGTNTGTPIQPGLKSNMPTLGRTGYGFESQNSFLTALFDAASFLKAKITILGDPDLLPAPPTYNEQLVYDKYYSGSNGYSLNATGGQVFIEINFKEGVDYTSQTGTMSINDSIAFTKYPPSIAADIKSRGGGVSYTLLSVNSSFSGGMFKQTLDTILNNFNNEDPEKETTEQAALRTANENASTAEQTAATGPNPGKGGTTSVQTTGTPNDPAQKTNSTPTTNQTPNAAATTATTATPTVSTPSGPVAADDGKSTNSAPTVKPGR